MVPKPAPSRVFFDKVTLELSFKGWVVVSQAKANQKGRPGRGDSQSHGTQMESSLANAFSQVTVEYLLPTRLSSRRAGVTSAALVMRRPVVGV